MKRLTLKLIILCALALTATLLLCACGGDDVTDGTDTGEETQAATDKEVTEGMVLFENGEYKFTFIAPALADLEVTELRNELARAFKAKTGVTPTFKKDDAVEASADSPEVLFGQTDREASGAPEGTDEERDAYYSVYVTGNKLVINGSDSYQLGLAVDYFIENYLSGDKVETLSISPDINKSEVLKGYTRSYWGLPSIPAYPEGKNLLYSGTYNCGTTIKNYAAGITDDSSILQRVKKTDTEEFAAYIKKLESYGFKKEYESGIENNFYVGMYDGKQRIYLTYSDVNSVAKIVLDPTGMSLDEFGYSYTPKAGEQSVYYQYGIPMADGTGNGHPNCGMLLVIKCADNSVIVIDGGDGDKQMNATALAGLNDFLHNITDTPTTGKIRISAWYMTHYHSDHILGFYDFLSTYGDSYTLERVIANLPTDDALAWNGLSWSTGIIKKWNTLINAKYPECKDIKVHTGQEIQIADVTLTVLYTHEDLLTDAGKFNSTDSNDMSTVIRVDNGKMSMLVLGDANTRTQSEMMKTFTAATFKCDILQAAHHMIYELNTIYKWAAPSIVYVPQNSVVAQNNEAEHAVNGTTYLQKLQTLINLVGEENLYFGGDETVGFASVDGTLTKVYYRDGVIGKNNNS